MRGTALIATATLLAVAHGAAASQDAAAPARNGPILFSSDQVAGQPTCTKRKPSPCAGTARRRPT